VVCYPYGCTNTQPPNRPTANRPQVRNHEAVVKFALRGPGQPGPRPVMAPLADPTAVPALGHMQEADAALRHVAHALLVGVDAKQVSPQALQVRPKTNAGASTLGPTWLGAHRRTELQAEGTIPPPDWACEARLRKGLWSRLWKCAEAVDLRGAGAFRFRVCFASTGETLLPFRAPKLSYRQPGHRHYRYSYRILLTLTCHLHANTVTLPLHSTTRAAPNVPPLPPPITRPGVYGTDVPLGWSPWSSCRQRCRVLSGPGWCPQRHAIPRSPPTARTPQLARRQSQWPVGRGAAAGKGPARELRRCTVRRADAAAVQQGWPLGRGACAAAAMAWRFRAPIAWDESVGMSSYGRVPHRIC
jgi:hypothetical protein